MKYIDNLLLHSRNEHEISGKKEEHDSFWNTAIFVEMVIRECLELVPIESEIKQRISCLMYELIP